ncbi:CREB-regulated transcription coactivator 1, partial [Trichinella nelsoni]
LAVLMASGIPRKFSEKIAIQQRKLNEDQSAFEQIMAEVHSITRKSATEAVDSELFAPGNLKAGRSLPNVHHFSSNVSGSNFTRNWVNANHGTPVAEYGSDRFVLHPSRGRSPGSHCHYSPYQRSLSPQTAHFESKFERHVSPVEQYSFGFMLEKFNSIQGPQTFSAQHYLQPPADSSWRRKDLIYCSTHSDPVLHASVVIGAYNNSMSAGFSQINHQQFTPTHSPPLNDSSSCKFLHEIPFLGSGSPMCEACASSYYMCSQHEKVMSPVRSNDNTIQQTQATDVDSSSVYPDISTSPPSISSHSAPSPGDNMNAAEECACNMMVVYPNQMTVCADSNDGSQMPSVGPASHFPQVSQKCPRTSFSHYRDSTTSAPCSPCDSVATNDAQSSSPVPANVSPSSSYYMLQSQLQNFGLDASAANMQCRTDMPDYNYELFMEREASFCGQPQQSQQKAVTAYVTPNDFPEEYAAADQAFFRSSGPATFGAVLSSKGNIPDIILTGADGSVRNSTMVTSTNCPVYYTSASNETGRYVQV